MRKLSSDLSVVTRVGLDLAKQVFQVHSVDAGGAEIDKRAIRRGKLIDYFAALPPVTIGIEACNSGDAILNPQACDPLTLHAPPPLRLP